MRRWLHIIVLGIMLGGLGYYTAFSDEPRHNPIAAMAVSLSPELAKERDPFKIALILRNQIYRNVRVEPTPDGVDWFDLEAMYRDSVVEKKFGHECGGRVVNYLSALKAFGIRARYVGLFTAVDQVNPEKTFVHASVEIFHNGRWVVMDPHYNLSLRDSSGRRIGWLDAQRLLAAKNAVAIFHDGYAIDPDVSLERYLKLYDSSLKQLTSFIVTGISLPGEKAIPVSSTGPWDGSIRYIDGSDYDVLGMAEREVYQLLLPN